MLDKILEFNSSIYVNKEILKGNLTKINSIRINANIKEEVLENLDWLRILREKECLIIDMDASNEIHQRKFISIIKDRKYKTYYLKDTKIIVTSSKIDTISNEILSYLIIL